MFMAAQYTIAKCWKQPKCPSVMNGSENYGTFAQCNTMQQKKKKELLPFVTAWMELESIRLNEISQMVRDKYHMISPLTGT